MKLKEAIEKRRSVRSYTKKKPDWHDIFDCLDLTRLAPMAGGYFTLRFILIDDEEKIKEIAHWASQDFISQAKYAVLFISEPSITKNLYKEKGEKFMHGQAGAAIQNFMLSLTEKGLSTCWIGHFNEEKIKKILKIPENQIIEAIFPIGYENEKPKTRKTQAILFDRLYFNEWGNDSMKRINSVEHYSPEGYANSKI